MTFPARLHVLLAQDSPRAVVIRRGPSKTSCTILWNRQNDSFEVGQWIRARVYEHRSDLSPNGKHLIYFAHNGQWQSESKGAWSAVSRAPYLKALAFYPKGDTWGGGGFFTGKTTYWLDDCGVPSSELRTTGEVQRDHHFNPYAGGRYRGVYYLRLLRDGWTIAEIENPAKPKDWRDVFDKSGASGWVLRKILRNTARPGKGSVWEEHQLLHPKSGRCLSCPDWEWADWDGKRVVWASGGRIFAGRMTNDGLTDESRLADFNGMAFEPLSAPY